MSRIDWAPPASQLPVWKKESRVHRRPPTSACCGHWGFSTTRTTSPTRIETKSAGFWSRLAFLPRPRATAGFMTSDRDGFFAVASPRCDYTTAGPLGRSPGREDIERAGTASVRIAWRPRPSWTGSAFMVRASWCGVMRRCCVERWRQRVGWADDHVRRPLIRPAHHVTGEFGWGAGSGRKGRRRSLEGPADGRLRGTMLMI